MTESVVTGPLRRVAGALAFGQDGRPRAVYRAVAPLLVAIVGLIVGDTVEASLTVDAPVLRISVESVVAAAVTLSGLAVTARVLDGRSLADYGFARTRRWLRNVGVGGLAGVMTVVVAFGLGTATGSIRVIEVAVIAELPTLLPILVAAVVPFVAVSALEETVLRGAVLTNVAEGFAARSFAPTAALGAAWLISTAVFAALHGPLGVQPSGASLIGMVVVWTAAGGLLGLAYLLTGELALPIGLHTGINWAANYLLLGTAEPTLVRVAYQENPLWHPMAGLPLLAGLVLAGCLVTGYVIRSRDELELQRSILRRPEKQRE